MNLRYFIVAILIIGGFTFTSCTDGGADNDPDPSSSSSLNLSSNIDGNELATGSQVTFTVTDDNGQNLTSGSRFYLIDQEIENNYVFLNTGEFAVTAKYDGLSSNALTMTVTTKFVVKVSSEVAFLGDEVTFTALNNEDNSNVTDEATFFVNNNPIEGNTFSGNEIGSYEVYAEIDAPEGVQTASSTNLSYQLAKKKILVEDFTGTWCGYCPRLASAISQAVEQSDRIIPVAMHNDDEFTVQPFQDELENSSNVSGFPSGRINRTQDWDETPEQLLEYASGASNYFIGLNSTLSGNTLNIETNILFGNSSTDEKLVVMIVENNLIEHQKNYYNSDPESEWYQMGNPIEDFEHDEVFRKPLTDIFGDQISQTSAMSVYTQNYSSNLSYCENAENAEIVAFLVDAEGNVLQAEHAKINETIEVPDF
jgi:thiol-disulfide isomerase/thioredoxin